MNSETIIGLDVGARRIGVAWGDTEVKIATPVEAIENDNDALEKIVDLVQSMSATTIVVGLPRSNQGLETAQSDFCRDFAEDLVDTLKLRGFDDVAVAYQDESLTSVKAEEQLRANKKTFRESMLRDGTLDSHAAAIILTDYLERAIG